MSSSALCTVSILSGCRAVGHAREVGLGGLGANAWAEATGDIGFSRHQRESGIL